MNTIEPPSTVPFDGVIQTGFGTIEIILCFVLLFLLIMSALISGSEAAFFSLSPLDKENLKSDDSSGGGFVSELLKKPNYLQKSYL